MSAGTYRLTLQGDGIEVNREIDESKALAVLEIVLRNHSQRGQTSQTGHVSTADEVVLQDQQKPELSIGEFLSQLKATTNPERIAGIALYCRDQLKKDYVLRSEIGGWFARAGLPVPKNVPRDIMTAVKKNLIAEAPHQEGAFYVTVTGEKHLRKQDS